MKTVFKQLLAVLALCGLTSTAFGYDFTFNNKTDKAIAVKLNLVASLADFDDMAVVQPGTSYKFAFTGFKSGFCLSKVSFGTIGQQSLTQTYPGFVEAEEYTVSELRNVCQNSTFDIVDEPGVGLIIKRLGARLNNLKKGE